MKPSTLINQLDDFDILCSTWILSCNDENSIITYSGIKFRLNIEENYDLKKLIRSRGDLFRLKVPQSRLDTWKQEMLNGKKIPSFIHIEKDPEKRKALINALTIEDVFRSQFRSEANALKSDAQILNWGLQHLDRLRQSQINRKEDNLKRKTTFWIPVISLIITLSISFFTVSYSNYTQIQLKKYEVTFKIKQENYSRFMQGLYDTFGSADGKGDLPQNINQLEITYFNIEPFLNRRSRSTIWNEFQRFNSMCLEYNRFNKSNIQENVVNFKQYSIKQSMYIDSLITYKDRFHDILYPVLFEDN